MPRDEPVNLSVGRSRAASMRRSIIPKLLWYTCRGGNEADGGILRPRRPPSGYVNQDQIILCLRRRVFPFSCAYARSLARGRARPWKYFSPFTRNYRINISEEFTGPRSCAYRIDFGLHPGFDVGFKWQALGIHYPRNDNRWITRV